MSINILGMLILVLVFLSQAVLIALKIIAKRAEKKNEVPLNPGNSNSGFIKNKMWLEHDRKITLNTNNILHIEKKIDKNAEENRRAHNLMFKKLDDLKG